MLVAAALALAACGSSKSSGTSADPAGAVPASAPVYAGADVRPEGTEKTNALAAGHAITGQADPYVRLLAALQAPGAPPLDFARDVSPWLGPHAGIFLSSVSSAAALLPLLEHGLLGTGSSAGGLPFGTGHAQGAIVLDTSDLSKATSFVEAQAKQAGAHAASYRGAAYQATAGGIAFGVVHRFVVIGSESGLHSVVDTTLGGPALAQASSYAKLLAQAPAGALAHVYSDPTAGGEAAAGAKASGVLALLAGTRKANISLVAGASSLDLYADTITSASTGTPGGLLSASSEGAKALGELPGDSWLALGLAHLGQSLGSDIVGLRELASLGTSLGGSAPSAPSTSALSVKSLLEGLLAPLSVLSANSAQARHDFTSWMGSGAVYAAGSGLLELKGAVIIESKNAALSRLAVAKLAAELHRAGDPVVPARIPGAEASVGVKVSGLPLLLNIASGRDASGKTKFVLGLGEASVTDALHPSSTLASAPARQTAATALGEGIEPSIIFEVPTLLSLL
ncbi:MAG TPA: DUF3352 domain-containing protein, partial [Solirubrobacteraceae bacterium]